MTCQTVPEQISGQSLIAQPLMVSPFLPSWYVPQVVTGIPAEAVGWHVNHGWRVVSVTYDNTTVPPTPYYNMNRLFLANDRLMQSLMDEYATAYNLATTNNAIRYNDIVLNWTTMLHTSHDQFDAQFDKLDVHSVTYLGDLDTYMDEIETLIQQQLAELPILETNHITHSLTATAFLDNLGATDLARINEEFAARLSQQLQKLTDSGWYSSPVATDIMERNARDRDEQIQALNDRLMREKWENDHRLYEQQTAMKRQKMDEKTRAIAEKFTEAKERLDGLQQEHDECMKLMAYQLDERNKILVGLYGFVERRDDVYPPFESLTQIAALLGDTGGAT